MVSQIQIFLAWPIWSGLYGFALIYSINTLVVWLSWVAGKASSFAKTSEINNSLFICAFTYGPITSKLEKYGELNWFLRSSAIIAGAFFSTLESWKHGNAKSPGIFSGGISMIFMISSTPSWSFSSRRVAKRSLYAWIIFLFVR